MGVDPKACVWLQTATSCRWRTVSPSTFKEIFSGIFSTIGDKTNSFPQLCYTPPALHPGEEKIRRRRRRRRGNSIPIKQTASPSSPALIPQQQQQQQQKKMRRSWINYSFRCKMPSPRPPKDSSKAHHHHPHELWARISNYDPQQTQNKKKRKIQTKPNPKNHKTKRELQKSFWEKKNEEKKKSKTQSPTDLLQTAVLATKWKWQHQKHTPAQVLCSIFIFLLFLIFFPHWPPFLYPFQIPMAKGLRTQQFFLFLKILKKINNIFLK